MIRTAWRLFRRRGSCLEVAQAAPAGAAARPDEPGLVFSMPEHETFVCRRTARVDFFCNAAFATAVLAVAVAFVWPASNRHPPAPAITSTLALAAVVPAAPAVPQGAPVRIKNAFDATEVFEFPHGTSESEARKAVGQLLLSRARDRQPDRGGAVQRPAVFVTRLLAPQANVEGNESTWKP